LFIERFVCFVKNEECNTVINFHIIELFVVTFIISLFSVCKVIIVIKFW